MTTTPPLTMTTPMPDNHLVLRDNSPAQSLSTLRALPASRRHDLRNLRLIMTETHLLAWNGHISASVYEVLDAEDIAEYAHIHQWPTSTSPDPSLHPSREFSALLAYIADSSSGFDLPHLTLEVELGAAAWELHDDTAAPAYDEDIETHWRFVYEWYMDVGRMVCEAFAGKEMGGVRINTTRSIREFEGVGAWLEREVTGEERVVGRVPAYHDAEGRLAGSKYRPRLQTTGRRPN